MPSHPLRRLLTFVVVIGAGVATLSAQSPRADARRAVRLETKVIQSASPAGTLAGATRGNPVEIALRYLNTQRAALGLTGLDMHDVVVASQHTSEHNGVTHVYLSQRHRGIEVYGAIANVNIARDGSVLSAGSSFASNVQETVNRESPNREVVDAGEAAARHLGLRTSRALRVRESRGGPALESVLDDAGISRSPIQAKLVYVPVEDGALRLAWMLDIEQLDGQNWWHITVDADTGEVLGQEDLVVHDHWGPGLVIETDDPRIPGLGLSAPQRPAPYAATSATMTETTETDGGSPDNVPGTGSYNVFALPLESPSHGPRSLVVDPADALASPFGWHDTNGEPGPEFTITRGNNVHAYTDIDANNQPDPGSEPDGGPSLLFDLPLDLTQSASSYRPFAVANLFYWNNIVHDVFYGYGFTESAGNFQVNNYGRFALGANDDVRAEAQDGSGTNNANFATPVDGNRPRMQMFIWTHPQPNTVTIAAGPAAGAYLASGAVFGPPFDVAGITAPVALVNDGTVDPTLGCGPLVGFPAGAIALADRGACPFVDKVLHAQNAGAVAVIVGNNAPGNPITMGGTSAAVVIPSAMVSLDNANLFKAALPFTANVALDPTRSLTRDSDLDAGVIAHEYAHGISNRLTGGRTVVNCLNNQEQMGEGWSDWAGLVLTTTASHFATERRGIGTYLLFQGTDGNGIRPTPYSTDMTINPSTYDTIRTVSVPHGVGYVWATMLWENYWDLVEKHGFNPDVYGDWTTGGNNLAMQLVVDGMKLQVCRPGFVDGRNAILQADMALTGGANQCTLWKGFAKRGLGLSANQGLASSVLDGTEAFDQPLGCEFGGFFPPIASAPSVNTAKAQSAIPVKFSLGGDYGLDVLVGGLPVSRRVDCETHEPLDGFVPIETPGDSTLTYDAATEQYTVVWKTPRAWTGQCRELRVNFDNDVWHNAYFRFF